MASAKLGPKDLCKKALKLAYGENVAETFDQYVVTEAYDEDTYQDDIAEVKDDELDESSVIEKLSEEFSSKFSTDDAKRELLSILKHAIADEFSEIQKIIDARIPIGAIIDPSAIKWSISRDNSGDAKAFMKQHTPNLIEQKEEKDKTLIDVIAIGFKNKIPLLNWLTDTYSRYRVNNHYFDKKDINTADWVKEYPFFKTFNNKNLKTKLNTSISSFFKRLFSQISFKNVTLVDDNINEFAEYFIAMSEAIDILVKKGKNVPFQIDLWIIPKNVESAINEEKDEDDDPDSGDDGEEESDQTGVDRIGDIESRLKENNFKYEIHENDQKEKIKRIFVQRLEAIINDRRNQRIIIYIDRRNPKYVPTADKMESYIDSNYGQNRADIDDNKPTLSSTMKQQRRNDGTKKTWPDTIYFIQSPNKKYSELPTECIPEISFWASTQCLLPKLKKEKIKEDGYGCRNDLNGFQFMLSWHVESADLIRCYWFSSCWGTRMLPYDCYLLWPKYFKPKNNNKLQSVNKDQTEKLKTMTQTQNIHDPGFINWYQKTTNSKLVLNL